MKTSKYGIYSTQYPDYHWNEIRMLYRCLQPGHYGTVYRSILFKENSGEILYLSVFPPTPGKEI